MYDMYSAWYIVKSSQVFQVKFDKQYRREIHKIVNKVSQLSSRTNERSIRYVEDLYMSDVIFQYPWTEQRRAPRANTGVVM